MTDASDASAHEHLDGYLTGAGGGQVYWQSWEPADPKAVVVIAHGLAEHSGRYAHVAKHLNEAGYAVAAGDHCGHGRSEGVKGNIERMVHLLDDLDAVLKAAVARHLGLPVFLLGHSLGGLIALDYLISRGDEHVDGLVLSAPAVDPSIGTRTEKLLARLLSGILPNLALTTLDSKAVSRDPDVVAAYESDPFNYLGKVRVRTGAESLASVSRVAANLAKVTVPVLVLQGSEDRLVKPIGAELVRDRVSSKDVTHKSYQGLYHEIFNEPEQDEVLADVVRWLDAHLSPTSASGSPTDSSTPASTSASTPAPSDETS
jgi:alpha-beta hydrolase superfamily lysophospholipase